MKKPSPIVCLSPFQILKKVYLLILKKPNPIGCLSPFQTLEKVYFQILQKTWTNFLLIKFFKY